MTDRVVIPLPGIGTLELTRETYEAALRPIESPEVSQRRDNPDSDGPELVTAKALAATLSLPVSCLYEYAKAGRIPCVRAGKHVRFSVAAVLAALRATDGLAVGHS
jgi:excisionase family DNA binding protein